MRRSTYLFLFGLGLGVALVVSAFQNSPGYMDADYYYLGGLRLADGHGFSEPVLWNYLDDPRGLPHASHAYWMPFASILASFGLSLREIVPAFRLDGFSAARIVFLSLAGCIPPITAWLSCSLHQRRNLALLAGVLSALPGFYLPFLTTTDTFLVYMLLGTLFLQLAWSGHGVGGERPRRRAWVPLALGATAGLMHLSRADGAIWMVVGALAVFDVWRSSPGREPWPGALWGLAGRFLLLLAGYFLVMGPWLARNLLAFGTPLAPGGFRTLWLVEYNQIFTYPATDLNFSRWWAAGVQTLLNVRLRSIGLSLAGAVAVQGLIFLAPLIPFGLWRLRHDLRIRWTIFAWVLTFSVMTLVFPEPGWRGGFFHSGAALQPIFWAVVPVGLDAFIKWGGQRRGWQVDQARVVFSGGLVGFALLLTGFSLQQRVLGAGATQSKWDESAGVYAQVDASLHEQGAGRDDIVVVNNPPGFYVTTGRQAIVIPNGSLDTLLAVARRYRARFLVLEPNHPQELQGLYEHPDEFPGLTYLGSQAGAHLFRFE